MGQNRVRLFSCHDCPLHALRKIIRRGRLAVGLVSMKNTRTLND